MNELPKKKPGITYELRIITRLAEQRKPLTVTELAAGDTNITPYKKAILALLSEPLPAICARSFGKNTIYFLNPENPVATWLHPEIAKELREKHEREIRHGDGSDGLVAGAKILAAGDVSMLKTLIADENYRREIKKMLQDAGEKL